MCRIFLCYFCILLNVCSPLPTLPEENVDPEDPKACGSYRELARLPNPFAKRGQTCCTNSTCYLNTEDSPWGHVSELPECSDKILPEFSLFTPETNESVQTVDCLNLSRNSNLDLNISRQFYTIIHGWNTKWKNSWVVPMKDALIDLGYNVLVVNWTNGSNIKDYVKSVANTRTVGETVAEVLQFLNDSNKIRLTNTTIIGFSLGSHVAGYAGRNLPGLWRIIGLDPAGPYFVCEHPLARLDKTDASFVMTIHSNGDTIFQGGMGTLETMGHIDFYPNGGIVQPGCEQGPKNFANKIIHFDFSQLANGLSCSHTRAPLLWIEIIKQTSVLDSKDAPFYKAFACNNSRSWKYGLCFDCGSSGCPTPGLLIDSKNTPQTGKYYFNTLLDVSESGHFCGRQYKLTLTSDVTAKGQITVILKGDDFQSNPIEFQKDWHTIKGGVPRSEILVTEWSLSNVTEILLTYNRYTNLLWRNGIKKFKLSNCTLTTSDGLIYSAGEKNVDVVSGETINVHLL